jgi:multiple sugar transport system permease protein
MIQRATLVRQTLAHAFLLAVVFVMLFPFWWMLITSTRPESEVFSQDFSWFPETFLGLDNYVKALEKAPIWRYMLNGVVVCLGVLVVQLATSIPCAWALAKYEFKGRGLLFGLVLMGLAVPIQVTALPLYLGLFFTGGLNSYFGLMVPFFLSVFAIFLFRQNFKSFPEEITQAARLDGMTEAEILWRLAVPSIRPAIAAFAVFSVLAHWNDLYWPMIVVTDRALMTPPLGMMPFADSETGTNFGPLMAAAAMITMPLVLFFLVAQRHFLSGFAVGAQGGGGKG